MRVSSDFRELARRALSGKWGSAVLTTLVASILGADIAMAGGPSVSRVTNYVSNTMGKGGSDHSYSTQLSSLSVTTLTYIFGAVMAITGLIIIIGLVQYVIGSFVSLGLIQYNLDLIDGRDAELSQIFSKASMFGKAFWLRLRMSIFTFLWSLLFIIPGIIKAYSYSMSGFILTENPEMTAEEAMEVSMKMMKGNKWRTFILDISFLGWYFLSVLTFGLLSIFWVNPYNAATIAELYITLRKQAIKEKYEYYEELNDVDIK